MCKERHEDLNETTIILNGSTKSYLKPCETSMMQTFCKNIVAVTIFVKNINKDTPWKKKWKKARNGLTH